MNPNEIDVDNSIVVRQNITKVDENTVFCSICYKRIDEKMENPYYFVYFVCDAETMQSIILESTYVEGIKPSFTLIERDEYIDSIHDEYLNANREKIISVRNNTQWD